MARGKTINADAVGNENTAGAKLVKLRQRGEDALSLWELRMALNAPSLEPAEEASIQRIIARRERA